MLKTFICWEAVPSTCIVSTIKLSTGPSFECDANHAYYFQDSQYRILPSLSNMGHRMLKDTNHMLELKLPLAYVFAGQIDTWFLSIKAGQV